MFILMLIFWIIFNGAVTTEIVIFGACISIAVYIFACAFMDFSVAKDIMLLKRCVTFIEYLGILIWEIIKANIEMAKMIVIKQEYELHPVIFKVKTGLKSKTCKALLANSITLTPGTITIDVVGDELIIHAVDESLIIENEETFIFEKILGKLERGQVL